MLRPFVLNEIRPEVPAQTPNADDIMKVVIESIISQAALKEETFNRIQSTNDLESRLSNLSSGFKLVASIEVDLHSFILEMLKDEYGEEGLEWWTKGIPSEVRKKCSQRVEEDDNRCV